MERSASCRDLQMNMCSKEIKSKCSGAYRDEIRVPAALSGVRPFKKRSLLVALAVVDGRGKAI